MVPDRHLLFDHLAHDLRKARPGTGSLKLSALSDRIEDFTVGADTEAAARQLSARPSRPTPAASWEPGVSGPVAVRASLPGIHRPRLCRLPARRGTQNAGACGLKGCESRKDGVRRVLPGQLGAVPGGGGSEHGQRAAGRRPGGGGVRQGVVVVAEGPPASGPPGVGGAHRAQRRGVGVAQAHS